MAALTLNSRLHHGTPQPSLSRALLVSLGVHMLALVVGSIMVAKSIRTAPPQVMQVRLVGVPVPVVPSKKITKPEEIRTQASAAPREPPPEVKKIPPSKAQTKVVTETPKPTEEKPNPVEAQERPPLLDKTPEKKKVVKNDKAEKVVRDPEDYLAALDFVDELEKENVTPPKDAPAKTNEQAGEGPQIQLNLSEQGEVDGIRRHIERFWNKPIGTITSNLSTLVLLDVDQGGNLLNLRIVRASGQDAYDQSILRAIRKAIPLPLPSHNTEKFMRLELNFQG